MHERPKPGSAPLKAFSRLMPARTLGLLTREVLVDVVFECATTCHMAVLSQYYRADCKNARAAYATAVRTLVRNW